MKMPMIEAIATGSWLDRRRIAMVAQISLGATVLMFVALFATAHGTLDFLGRPLGTDFSNVWSAGWMALHGQAAEAWDWGTQAAVQRAVHHDPQVPFYGWHYPPPFMLVAALLALLPYVAALVVWQAVTLAAALWLVTRIVPDRLTLLAAAAAPVVMVCLGHGHNGFLTAALLGGGLLLLDDRPFTAGLLIGCLVYKPQFAVLLPLVLLASGQWRAVGGAILSAGTLVLVTYAIWGWPVWQASIDSLPLTRSVVIAAGNTGWEKIQTAFGAIRALGGSVPLAYAVQGAVTAVALLASLIATLRATPAVRNAVVLTAALLSTPYALDYDYTLAGMAIAFLVADGRARGFLRWEASLLAIAWAMPLFARSIAHATLIPLGVMSLLALFAVAVRRMALLDHAFANITPSPFRR